MRQSDEEKRFLRTVCEQVRWKQAHEIIVRDLSEHIEDQSEAFGKDGYSEQEANERAVREMGDPVDVGLLLDASYRPVTEKRLLLALGLLVLTGVLVRAAFYRLTTVEWLEYGASLFIGSGLFFMMLRINFYRMLKWAWLLEIGFILIVCVIPVVWFHLISYDFDYTYVQTLWLLSPVIYALVVYRLRGSGFSGLLICGFVFCVPLILRTYAFNAIGLFETVAAVACFVVTLLAIFSRSFDGNRILACIVTVLVVAYGTFLTVVSAPHRFARLLGMLEPSNDPLGAGWLTLSIREMFQKAVWFGKGGALSPATQTFVTENKSFSSDYVMSYLVYEKGYIIAVVLIALANAFLCFGFLRIRRIGSQLGKLLATGVLTVFAMQIFLYIVPCIGYPVLSSSVLPFVTGGNLTMILDFLLAGLLLSLFRTDTLYVDPPRKRKRLRVKFSIDTRIA